MDFNPHLVDSRTQTLITQVTTAQQAADTPYKAAQAIMPFLGAQVQDGHAQIGFWTPEIHENNIPPGEVYLEVFRPITPLDLSQPTQSVQFVRRRVALQQHGDFLLGVVAGMRPGTRDVVGDFYHVVYQKAGTWHSIPDYLAASIPFGAFAPAEYYDVDTMQAARTDRAHFARLDFDPAHRTDGIDRIAAPRNILQIHVRYASPEGTLAGLTRIYRAIAHKLTSGQALSPSEQNYIGYDAIQLMPIEPIIEYEDERLFWRQTPDEGHADNVNITLRKPDMTNWGYDVIISASSAINPALLESGRPDELLDFIATLHNFPGQPIKVMLDIVYGHIDNQGLPLLNPHFFAGANMYGQNVNFQHPVTRAILLEMMRRKHNYGVDGIRVDGAQDFKNYDPALNQMIHDDAYLHDMNDVTLHVAGQTYRPWMVFEDGRPWPNDDWELASTYREVTKQMPNVWQWGPLTFAHNTPFLFTFWMMKWWRVREMGEVGREWITGCANHDTLRRGSQTPTEARVNTYLGGNLREIFANGYDNPAAKLFDYIIMPGVPMDFINASMHAPWGFIRNTDDRYGVKVVSEEARFSEWLMTDAMYNRPDFFRRLKGFGFKTLRSVQNFMDVLDHAVQATRYDLDSIVRILSSDVTPDFAVTDLDVPKLKRIARAWMDDVHEFCNVSHYSAEVAPELAAFKLKVRNFRQARAWLMDNLRAEDCLDYLHPTDGTVLYYGLRHSPDSSEQVLFIANMEGAPITLTPLDLPIANLADTGWTAALVTPGVGAHAAESAVTLKDSQGVVFTRQASGGK